MTARVAAVAERPDLSDDVYVEFDGDPRKYRVGELRALAAAFNIAPAPNVSASAGQLAAFETQLRKVDPGFIRIVWTNTSGTVGKGVYLTRMKSIAEREKPFTFSGMSIIEPQLKPALTLDALGGYAKELAERRAAEQTPEESFGARYKAERLAEFASEPARVAAMRAAHGIPEPQLTVLAADELCKAPDPYKDGLEKLRERDARALAAKESR
jgi:hypothetical protein